MSVICCKLVFTVGHVPSCYELGGVLRLSTLTGLLFGKTIVIFILKFIQKEYLGFGSMGASEDACLLRMWTWLSLFHVNSHLLTPRVRFYKNMKQVQSGCVTALPLLWYYCELSKIDSAILMRTQRSARTILTLFWLKSVILREMGKKKLFC